MCPDCLSLEMAAGVIGYIYYNEVMFQYFMCVLIVFVLEIAAGVIGYIYYNEVRLVSVLYVCPYCLCPGNSGWCYRIYLL